jgi:hypothetical protein
VTNINAKRALELCQSETFIRWYWGNEAGQLQSGDALKQLLFDVGAEVESDLDNVRSKSHADFRSLVLHYENER